MTDFERLNAVLKIPAMARLMDYIAVKPDSVPDTVRDTLEISNLTIPTPSENPKTTS